MRHRRVVPVILPILLCLLIALTSVPARAHGQHEPTPGSAASSTGANIERAVGALGKIQAVLEFYYLDHGEYPDRLSTMIKQFNLGAGPGEPQLQLPTDPATGRDFVYIPSSDHTRYRLRVPRPQSYGVDRLQVHQVNWAWMTRLAQAQKKRRDTVECAERMRVVASAINQYNRDHRNQFPEKLSQLVPRYLKVLPVCPATGKPYFYQATSRGFEIGCPNPSVHGFRIFGFSSTTGLERH